MASSSAASASTSASTVPDKYISDVAVMNYAVKDADLLLAESWISLETAPGIPNKFNVSAVVFDYSVSITQKSKEGGRCTLKLGPDEFADPQVVRGKNEADFITITIRCTGPYKLQLEGDETVAKKLPLAQLCGDSLGFEYIRLLVLAKKLTRKGGSKATNVAGLIGHLKTLLTGHITLDVDGRWNPILETDRRGLWLESEAQKAQLAVFKDCVIKTRPGRANKTVIVEVYPARPRNEDQDQAVPLDDTKNVGLSYWIEESALFPVDKETMQMHKILGAPHTEGWQLVVMRNTEHSAAAIVGTISNTFGQGIRPFVNRTDSGVTLEPIFNDIQGDRSRSSMAEYARVLDEEFKQIKGFFVDPETQRSKSLLPVDTIFGNLKCSEDENRLEVGDSQVPANILEKLNDTQQRALHQALSSKASVIQGPPGTGKSTFIGAMTRHLVANKGEKVAALAMANVAVDSLLESCVKMWRRFSQDRIPFARIYSESQILSQWAAGDFDLLNSECHIDHLRHLLALQDVEKYSGYLDGRKELETNGVITNEGLYKAYSKEAKTLARELLESDKVQVVFCTVASCQTPILYKQDKGTKKLKWYFKATTLFLDEAGTAHRPHFMNIAMTFVDARRFTIVGDPEQLPAFVLNPGTKLIWPKSYLKSIMDRGFPFVMLDTQYRMHDQLYDHLVNCIYRKAIGSHYLTSSPSPFLQRVLSQSLRVSTPRDTYHLKSFLHFIDVEDGHQESTEGGSSWNLAEVDHADAIVKAQLGAGFLKSDICVMTGYTAQLKLLGRKARENDWNDVKRILTIDSSQGSEYKIVIISLVRTGGSPGFLGQRPRANVGTSRQQEVLYFLGKAGYWFAPPRHSRLFMHRILARMNQTATGFIVKSQRSLLASAPAGPSFSTPAGPSSSTPAAPSSPISSPPSSSVKTGGITAIDLAAQLAQIEQERDTVIDLLGKEYRAESVELKDKYDADLLQAREDFETEIAEIKARLAEASI